MPYYLNIVNDGLLNASSDFDGYSITLKWATAYPSTPSNKIAYKIWLSSDIAPDFPINLFNSPPTFLSVNGSTSAVIVDLIPGQMYHAAVRAVEYNQSFFDLTTLPAVYNGLVSLPYSLLATDIDATDGYIPLIDASMFPNNSHCTITIGSELINYSSVDYETNTLILNSPSSQRGYNDTVAQSHNVDGYDGYVTWEPPGAVFYPFTTDEQNTKVYQVWNRFDVGHYPYTNIDGYRDTTRDILTTDLIASDVANTGFPAFSFSGYLRTDPTLLLSGQCVSSYLGGLQGCADGYGGVGQQIRGLNVQQQNNARQEVLLSLTGEPVCLMKREFTGITCKCFLPYNEYPDARCGKCFGSGKVLGYSQFFDPRRSDGRIMVRFDPAVDDLKPTDAGLESDFAPTCWTLTVPTLKDRYIIQRFDQDGNPEFRYEILNVTRNKLLFSNSGAQKFAVQRIRKTDSLYMIPIFYDTSSFPVTVQTGLTNAKGLGIHSHSVVFSNVPVANERQLTGIAASHNHDIYMDETGNLVVSTELSHTHSIIM